MFFDDSKVKASAHSALLKRYESVPVENSKQQTTTPWIPAGKSPAEKSPAERYFFESKCFFPSKSSFEACVYQIFVDIWPRILILELYRSLNHADYSSQVRKRIRGILNVSTSSSEVLYDTKVYVFARQQLDPFVIGLMTRCTFDSISSDRFLGTCTVRFNH